MEQGEDWTSTVEAMRAGEDSSTHSNAVNKAKKKENLIF